jgi:hypothetical protein
VSISQKLSPLVLTSTAPGIPIPITSSIAIGGDVTGSTLSSIVSAIDGNPIQAATYNALQDGYILTWINSDGLIEMKPGKSAQSAVASPSGTIVGHAIRTSNLGNVGTATTTLQSQLFNGVALTTSSSGQQVTLHSGGPILRSIVNLGSGIACAVGVDINGNLVRAIDPTCISAPNWIGDCDTDGTVTYNPRRANALNVLDFGADPTNSTTTIGGILLSDIAFTAIAAYATAGNQIDIPAGVYRYAKTWGPFASGVTLKGAGGFDITGLLPALGSVLNYTGLGDGVRAGNFYNTQGAGLHKIADLILWSSNAANYSPCRESPTQFVGGGVANVSNSSGLAKITTILAHGLVTGNLVEIDGVTGSVASAVNAPPGWTVTVIDSLNFTLDGSTFSGSYTSGGTVHMSCGAAIAAVGASHLKIERIYTAGFSIGVLLDGAEISTIEKCFFEAQQSGSNANKFSAGVWLTDGSMGCRGFTLGGGNTNVTTIRDCTFKGSAIGVLIDDAANTLIQGCWTQPVTASSRYYSIKSIGAHAGDGYVNVETYLPHNLATGDFVHVPGDVGSFRGLHGTTEAIGEWRVTVIDSTHFTIPVAYANALTTVNAASISNVINNGGRAQIVSVGHGLYAGQPVTITGVTGTVGAAVNGDWRAYLIDDDNFLLVETTHGQYAVFSGAYVSGGSVVLSGYVSTLADNALVKTNRAVGLTLDNCYYEGAGDAMVMFAKRRESSAAASNIGITIRGCFFIGQQTPWMMIAGESGIATSVATLLLQGNQCTTETAFGSTRITGAIASLGNYFAPVASHGLFDQATGALKGIFCDNNVKTSDGFAGTGFAPPSAVWDVVTFPGSIPTLRVSDGQNFNAWLDFYVNAVGSTDFRRNIQTAGAGNRSGVEDDLRTATILSSAVGTQVIATSSTVPPKTTGHFKITIIAHRDDDDATHQSTWIFDGTYTQQANGTLSILDAPAASYAYNPGGSGFTAPVVAVGGSTNALKVSTVANTAPADATWTTRFELTNAQRAR